MDVMTREAWTEDFRADLKAHPELCHALSRFNEMYPPPQCPLTLEEALNSTWQWSYRTDPNIGLLYGLRFTFQVRCADEARIAHDFFHRLL